MMSLLIRSTIVSVWLGLMLMLWQGQRQNQPDDRRHDQHDQRDQHDQGDPPHSPASAILPETEGINRGQGWMGLYMNGTKVGYSSFQISPNTDGLDTGGYTLMDRSVLRLRMMDSDQTVHAQTSAIIDDSYALRSFRLRLDSGVGDFNVIGTIADNRLSVDLDVGSQTDRRIFPLDGPIFLPSAVRLRLASSDLHAGDRTVASVFDPASLSVEPISVDTIGLETLAGSHGEVQAWRIVESYRGIQTTVWLDRQGNVLREEGPMGLVAVREDARRATEEGWGEDSLVDLMDAVAIPIDPPIESPRELRRLRVRLDGLGDLKAPSDVRQSTAAGSIAIQREDTAARATYRLPYGAQAWAAELAASAFVQSDHPKIRAAAARVLAGEIDARTAAVRLRKWVYASLEKRAVASIPNALQVLEMGAGDCNEHAVLFAGVARAAGLPTRVVAGVVYAEGVFLYHAWNEVWLGREWVSVDAAFDQMPTDATHIKLVIGEPDQHIALIPVIGRLSIEVIDSKGHT